MELSWVENLVAVFAGVASILSVVLTIHWKREKAKEGVLNQIFKDLDAIKETVSRVQQESIRSQDRVTSLEKETLRLETALEKDIVEVKQAIADLRQLIIDLITK